MTVKQLMRKLKSVPEDYEVTMFITDTVFKGLYKVDEINIDECDKQVEVATDYKYLWNEDEQKWEK